MYGGDTGYEHREKQNGDSEKDSKKATNKSTNFSLEKVTHVLHGGLRFTQPHCYKKGLHDREADTMFLISKKLT